MPIVGFGLWKVNNDTCADQVYNAIKTGYRLFDGAVSKVSSHRLVLTIAVRYGLPECGCLRFLTRADYGNEVESGQGIARAIKEGLV